MCIVIQAFPCSINRRDFTRTREEACSRCPLVVVCHGNNNARAALLRKYRSSYTRTYRSPHESRGTDKPENERKQVTGASLAERSALVASEPEVGVATAPDLVAAAGGHVGHPGCLVLCAVRSPRVSLWERSGDLGFRGLVSGLGISLVGHRQRTTSSHCMFWDRPVGVVAVL